MRDRSMRDVVVVGGGAVGAACAAAVAMCGGSVALIEPNPPQAASADAELDTRVIALSPASVRFAERIGAWPLPPGRAFPYRDMRVVSGDETLHFGRELVGEPALGWIVELRALQANLFAAAERQGAVVHRTRVVSCERGADDARVTLDDNQILRTKLVASAEGGRSSLRESAGIATHGRDYACRAIVAHLQTELPNPGTAFQRFLPGGPLAFLPIGEGGSSLVLTRPEADIAEWLALDDAAFMQRVSEASGHAFGAVVAMTARHAFPLRLQLADAYVATRLALLGDTAHVVHPLAGLGLNLGLMDAAALADVLEAARHRGRDPGSDATLSRYDSWRRSDTRIIAHGVDAIERGFKGDLGIVTPWLARGLSLVNALEPAKRFLAAAACGDIGRIPELARR